MSKYENLFAPMTPAETAAIASRGALASVQSSLFQRFGKTFGRKAGAVSWMLVRLTQPRHRDHAAAHATIRAASVDQLLAMADAVALSLTRPKNEACAGLLKEIQLQITLAQRDVYQSGRVKVDEDGVVVE